jgi:hypothetical protein
MRVRVDTPELLDDLLAFLGSSPNTVVEQVSEEELEVSLLGSYREDAMRMELYLRLRAWEAAKRASGARVEIVD